MLTSEPPAPPVRQFKPWHHAASGCRAHTSAERDNQLLTLLHLRCSAVNDALFNEPSIAGGDSSIVLVRRAAVLCRPRCRGRKPSMRRVHPLTICLHTLMQKLSCTVPLTSESTTAAQVRDIEFASTCEATLLPFHGRCHIAYVPASGVVLGLSKFARLTTLCARRLQSQQGLANDIISALQVTAVPVTVPPGDAVQLLDTYCRRIARANLCRLHSDRSAPCSTRTCVRRARRSSSRRHTWRRAALRRCEWSAPSPAASVTGTPAALRCDARDCQLSVAGLRAFTAVNLNAIARASSC